MSSAYVLFIIPLTFDLSCVPHLMRQSRQHPKAPGVSGEGTPALPGAPQSCVPWGQSVGAPCAGGGWRSSSAHAGISGYDGGGGGSGLQSHSYSGSMSQYATGSDATGVSSMPPQSLQAHLMQMHPGIVLPGAPLQGASMSRTIRKRGSGVRRRGLAAGRIGLLALVQLPGVQRTMPTCEEGV